MSDKSVRRLNTPLTILLPSPKNAKFLGITGNHCLLELNVGSVLLCIAAVRTILLYPLGLRLIWAYFWFILAKYRNPPEKYRNTVQFKAKFIIKCHNALGSWKWEFNWHSVTTFISLVPVADPVGRMGGCIPPTGGPAYRDFLSVMWVANVGFLWNYVHEKPGCGTQLSLLRVSAACNGGTIDSHCSEGLRAKQHIDMLLCT